MDIRSFDKTQNLTWRSLVKSCNKLRQHQVPDKDGPGVFLFASLLFGTALLSLKYLELPETAVSPMVLTGFLVYSLFTLTVCYKHPYFGCISLDRAAQMLCLLTLGSFHAAWITGLSYFLVSWLRLFRGASLMHTINAVMINSGMMTLVLLLGGKWYQWQGGEIPMIHISQDSLLLVFSTLLVMQLLNQALMYVLVYLQGGNPNKTINFHGPLLEMGIGLVGMALALVYNRQDLSLFFLLLLVISAGMLVMSRYANIRLHLEALVRERTRTLRDLARQDSLTGISNRRHADEFIADQIDHARQTGAPLSIALLDIDHFKRINDKYLHATGDKVLQHLSRILKHNCRASDFVGRYGGEEFLICFPLQNLESARLASEKLRSLVEKQDWDRIAPGLKVTVSLGVAQWEPGMRTEDLVKAADQKLYEAKSAGRNRVCY